MEERVKKLETIATRLMRRANKVSKAFLSPYPISNAVFGNDVKGTILCYMFPCNGTVSKGFVRFGSKPKGSVNIDIQISNDSKSSNAGVVLDKKISTIEPNLSVTGGDCLKIVMTPLNETIITEVWISFLWIPTIEDSEIKRFLISELESLIEES